MEPSEKAKQAEASMVADDLGPSELPPNPDEVAALYGLQPRQLKFDEEEIVDLLSQDSEPIERPSSSRATMKRPAVSACGPTKAESVVYHLDYAARCLVKMCGNDRICGEMSAGPNGFALATFKDSAGTVLETRTTEMPNVMLSVVTLPLAKAQAKAKAKAKAKGIAKAKAKGKAKAKAKAKSQPSPPEATAAEAPSEAPSALEPAGSQSNVRYQAEHRSMNNSFGIRKVWRSTTYQECKRQALQILCKTLSKEPYCENTRTPNSGTDFGDRSRAPEMGPSFLKISHFHSKF